MKIVFDLIHHKKGPDVIAHAEVRHVTERCPFPIPDFTNIDIGFLKTGATVQDNGVFKMTTDSPVYHARLYGDIKANGHEAHGHLIASTGVSTFTCNSGRVDWVADGS